MINLRVIFSIILSISFAVFAGDFSREENLAIIEIPTVINKDYDVLLIVDAWPGDYIVQFLEAVKDAKEKNLPIILVDMPRCTEQDDDTDIRIKTSLKDYRHEVIIKDWSSAFHETKLATYLKDNNLYKIFLIGTSTDICIKATIEHGIERGFTFVLSSKFFDAGLPDIVNNPDLADKLLIF